VFCGHNPSGSELRPELVPLVFQHLPAGTSVQVMAHWAQVRDWPGGTGGRQLLPAHQLVVLTGRGVDGQLAQVAR